MATMSRSVPSRRRRRDLFTIDALEVEPDRDVPHVTLPGHAPSIHYEGAVPELATIAGTPSRRTPTRIDVLSRRFVSFGTSPSRPATQIVLTPPIPSHAWVRGVLVARLHAVDTFPTATLVTISVQNVDVSASDPSVVFAGPAIATISMRNSEAAPKLYRDAFVEPGPRVRVVLDTTCAGSTPIGTLRVAISVQLIGAFS